MVSRLMMNVGTPCLVVSSLTRLDVTAGAVAQVGLLAVLALVCFTVVGLAALVPWRLSPRAYLPALVFGNVGNMGLPLSLFAFGTDGLTLAVAWFSVAAVAQLTLGSMLASGESPLRHVARSPIVYAVAIAAMLLATGTKLPEFAARTVELLGGMVIPLMLVALGVSLARLRVATFGRSVVLSLVRLGGGIAVGLLLTWAFGLEGATRGIVILQASMPVAVFNYLFAERYARQPEEIAAMVVISTLISFITMPLLLLLVLPGTA